jgi:hypothetical protein
MQKKIFFIHIGKTGGSSFNAFLKRHFTGENHCENYVSADWEFKTHLSRLTALDYISGHLKLEAFHKNHFPRQEYFLITFLRNPLDQLISHLNWIMYVYDLGRAFFAELPPEVQALSHELRGLDLYHPDTLITVLRNHQGFRNNQAIYFANNPHLVGSDAVIERMMQLDMIGISELYRESLEVFIDLNALDVKPVVDRENINPHRVIKRDILENRLISDFLQEYNAIDIEIYNYFKPKLLKMKYKINRSTPNQNQLLLKR